VKQVVQNYRSGALDVLDVPVPACKPGGVVVATRYSLISTGTEMMKVSEAKLSLIGKARQRPDQVRKVLDSVAQVGPVAAYQKAINKLDSYTPLGYSLCGVVLEVGAGVEEFKVGDVVACAGNEHALHAEVNWVPVNLCVPVPAGVDPRHAAFATVGAIAMHGVRRGEPQLGESAVVIGLGLVGQLVVQLLVAGGVRVIGVDPVESRCAAAEAAGALACGPPTPEGLDRLEGFLAGTTAGVGADHVFLAAGGSSSDPVHVAARLARDRARVVDIGKCSLDLPWNDYYEKELDVRTRSYGPGRYDPSYELDGVDYPAGYVRWTERRNLACFVDLLEREQLSVETLISEVFPVTDAVDVYRRLEAGALPGVGFLFSYPEQASTDAQVAMAQVAGAESAGHQSTAPLPHRRPGNGQPGTGQTVRLGFLGAGNYASSMLLPHLKEAADVELVRVATTTSLSAANAQRRFEFADATTDTSAVLDDETIDAVFIVTRHASHAELVCRALERGKTVFVEKPLALSAEQLDGVLAVVAATGNDRLTVGFNRRFAPMLVGMRARFGRPAGPSVIRYLVNAGRLDAKSWYNRTDTEGTRFEGEGGHFLDTVGWWLDSYPVDVHAVGTVEGDDVVATVGYDDGSVASIAYVTNGNPRFPKETFEVAAGGRSARLDNFRRSAVWTGRRRTVSRALNVDKGQAGQLDAFLAAVRTGGPMPIPLTSLAATTRTTLAVTASRSSGRTEAV